MGRGDRGPRGEASQGVPPFTYDKEEEEEKEEEAPWRVRGASWLPMMRQGREEGDPTKRHAALPWPLGGTQRGGSGAKPGKAPRARTENWKHEGRKASRQVRLKKRKTEIPKPSTAPIEKPKEHTYACAFHSLAVLWRPQVPRGVPSTYGQKLWPQKTRPGGHKCRFDHSHGAHGLWPLLSLPQGQDLNPLKLGSGGEKGGEPGGGQAKGWEMAKGTQKDVGQFKRHEKV